MRSPSIEEQLRRAAPGIVYVALIAYLFGISIYIRMSLATQLGFAVCVAVAAAVPTAQLLLGGRPGRQVWRIVVVSGTLSTAYLLPTFFFPQGRTVQHVAVDFATTLVPLGFLVAGTINRDVFKRLFEPRWAFLFVLPLLLSPIVAQDGTGARAFEPPNLGVLALLVALAVCGVHGWVRETAGVAAGAVMALAALSGSRSVTLIALLAFGVALLANRAARVVAVAALVGGLVFAIIGPGIDTADRTATLSVPVRRLAQLTWPGVWGRRVDEASLVVEDTRTRGSAWQVLGVGHGAVFEPAEWNRDFNLSDEGYVHNIHVGPVLLWFRYGLLGVALYVFLLVSVGVSSVRAFLGRRDGIDAVRRFAFSFGMLLFMIEFLVRNVLPNPMFSFFLAGYVALLVGSDPLSQVAEESAEESAEEAPA